MQLLYHSSAECASGVSRLRQRGSPSWCLAEHATRQFGSAQWIQPQDSAPTEALAVVPDPPHALPSLACTAGRTPSRAAGAPAGRVAAQRPNNRHRRGASTCRRNQGSADLRRCRFRADGAPAGPRRIEVVAHRRARQMGAPTSPRTGSTGAPRRAMHARAPRRTATPYGSRTLTTLLEMLPAASRTRAHTCCGRLGAYHTALPVVGYGCHHAPEKSLLALNCTSLTPL